MVCVCPLLLCQVHHGSPCKCLPRLQKGPQLYHSLSFTGCTLRPKSESLQIQGFEWYSDGGGVHWKKLTSLIPELSHMGITALWIPRNLLPFPVPF